MQQAINNAVEKIFHKKAVIKSVFIFPLISIVIIAIGLNDFIYVNKTVPYINEAKHLFIWILILLCINMLANFSALILYYCLHNRLEDITKKFKKIKKAS